MTIAGSDSGGGAGIQADMRTFAMLGVHGCVAVTAVTVQNSVGVKGFHEIPVDVIAGQIEAVASDIGIQAAKTGMLASSDIIAAVADTWRDARVSAGDVVPLVVDPVCASMHGDPLLHPSRAGFASHPTVSAGNAGDTQPRRGPSARRHRGRRHRHPARGRPRPARAGPAVGARQGRAPAFFADSPDLLYDGTDFYEFDAPRVDTGNDHGAGDTLAAATAGALAHGYPVPDAVAFAKQWVTECIRARVPARPRPRPGVPALPSEPALR